MATKKNLPNFDEYDPYSDLQPYPYRGKDGAGSNIPLNSKAQYVSLGNAGSNPGVNNDYNTLPEKSGQAKDHRNIHLPKTNP